MTYTQLVTCFRRVRSVRQISETTNSRPIHTVCKPRSVDRPLINLSRDQHRCQARKNVREATLQDVSQDKYQDSPEESRELAVGVEPESVPLAPAQQESMPLMSKLLMGIPVAFMGLIVMVKLLKASKGSLGKLEERGHLDSDRRPDSATPWDADSVGVALNKVNYMNYSDLTDDQILKQRRRRQMERDVVEVSLEEITIPENHPWATSAADDELTEDLIQDRLSVRRGIPRQRAQLMQVPDEAEESGSWNMQDDPAVQKEIRQRAQRRAQENMDRSM